MEIVGSRSWFEVVEQFSGVIRGWEQRISEVNNEATETGDHPNEPEPGSEMALDKEEMFYYFAAVWNALAQSVDHLGAVVDLIVSRPELRVFAYPSLLRTALLGSAEAVWLMGPRERSVRTGRAHLLSAEELRHHAAFLNDDPEERGNPAGGAAVFKQRRDQELAILARTGFNEKYEATAIIREAGAHVEQIMNVPQGTSRWYVSQWRMMSAQAHGRTWDKRYRAGYEAGVYNGEQRVSVSRGTVETLGQWMSASVGVTAAAWSLFDDGRRSAQSRAQASSPGPHANSG